MPTAVASVLDLRGLPDSDPGLCRTPAYVDGAVVGPIELPADPAAYPLKVLLPARTEPHPACVSTCTTPIREGLTALSVVFHLGLSNQVHAPTLVVSAPWQVISAGDGDPSSDACLGDYQEFGMCSCIRLPYGSTFGVAVATPPEAGGELLIEVAPKNADFTTNCCPYLPRSP